MDPFWAAILGGAVGGVIVALIESFLGGRREQERWLRDKRQRAYAEHHDILIRIVETHQELWFRARQPQADEPLEESAAKLNALFGELSVSTRQLDLIATPNMRQRAMRFLLSVAGFLSAVEQIITGAAAAHGEDPNELLETWQINESLPLEFAEAARAELGAGRDVRYRMSRWVRNRWRGLRAWWLRRTGRTRSQELARRIRQRANALTDRDPEADAD
jgi:hypothetical protein